MYKRQVQKGGDPSDLSPVLDGVIDYTKTHFSAEEAYLEAVSYTHLRAHETVLDLVCRLLLEKNKTKPTQYQVHTTCAHSSC